MAAYKESYKTERRLPPPILAFLLKKHGHKVADLAVGAVRRESPPSESWLQGGGEDWK